VSEYRNTILQGDALDQLRRLPNNLVDCAITSPPYWDLRDYGVEGQIGIEADFGEYIRKLVEVFRELRRVLKRTGTLWLNMGDTYASAWPCRRRNKAGNGSLENGKRENRPPRLPSGLKDKDLIGVPWRLAFALQADGWYLRRDIIWNKTNPAPDGAPDRPSCSHEYIFLLSKCHRYYYDKDAILEVSATGARNKRSVWTVPVNHSVVHHATYSEELIEPCIKAGCRIGGLVLDPFIGSGTTALVTMKLGRQYLGIELNPAYIEIANKRLQQIGLFAQAG